MIKLIKIYFNTFSGLSREVWWLALITLINRAGTMVIPFLSLYLTTDLNFSLGQVGWIMSAFGLGSVAGSWFGGKLTDKIGFYKVMVFSLFLSGILFIWLQFLKTFNLICLGIFLVMTVADLFRPAMFVALNSYSKIENKTRSITLIRLAINLGFSAGPAIGGYIITSMSYGGLFWVDGITCIAASLVLLKVLHPKKVKVLDDYKNMQPKSAFTDFPFMIFLLAMILFGVIFLQYFSTMPIYYKEVYVLNEKYIGLLLGLNGFLIFIIEMPLIKWLETKAFTKTGLMLFGALLTGLSFIILNMFSWVGILIVGIVLMSVGEMITFPFSNAFALQQAKRGNQGEYMALYTVAFSISQIIAHNAGLHMVDGLGFNTTWLLITFLAVLCVLLLMFLNLHMKRRKNLGPHFEMEL